MNSDKATKVAIAERVGWKLNDDWRRPGIGKWYEKKGEPARRLVRLPDYLNDLNACAEFEATLTDRQYESYRQELYFVAGSNDIRATARDRCAAFVKTMGLEARIKELMES